MQIPHKNLSPSASSTPATANLKKSELLQIIERVRPYTMVTNDSLLELARQVSAVLTLSWLELSMTR